MSDARCSGWGAEIIPRIDDGDGNGWTYADLLADEAYTLADAMLKRRASP